MASCWWANLGGMSRTLLIKTGITGILALLLLIPLAGVGSIVRERIALRDGVVANIQQSSVTPQRLVGPVLVVPFEKVIVDIVLDTKTGISTQQSLRTEAGQLLFLPETLEVNSSAKTQKRYRGIYSALLYDSDNVLTGNFAIPENFGIQNTAPETVTYRWGQAHVAMGIDDPRGIRGVLELQWNGASHAFEGGAGSAPLPSGVHAPLGQLPTEARNYRFAIDLRMQGAETLALVPTAKQTTFKLRSAWPHPSFTGQFLPETHTIGASGFEAVWRTSRLSSNVEQDLQSCNGQHDCPALLFKTAGVAFIEPVDIYLMLERSAKYGFLFITFTFVLFSLFELLKRLAIHPIQYALVGVALAMFFLLLVALSEHLPFAIAYAIAASSCVLLLGFYVSYVLKGVKRASGFAAALALLYGALYVLLQSEDMALLLGAFLLFGILSAIMIITRRVDWYRLGNERSAT
jgi:inner membrane protein